MTLGILGGGQLGRLIAEAARGLGLKTVAMDPSPDAPASKAVDRFIPGGFEKALDVARQSDVVTLEWELIPAVILHEVERIKPLHPGADELEVLQDRLKQKEFLKKLGLPQAPFGKDAKLPARLKTRGGGYDGKGQWRIVRPEDLQGKPEDTVLEQEISFKREFSVILTRAKDGQVVFFPGAENVHKNGILHMTVAPAAIPEGARKAAAKIAEALGHVGTLAVEFFDAEGGFLVNEIAPRVHNSGHYTLGACPTSQFEQHVRAVCGLPLGPVEPAKDAVMVNLLGDLWAKGEPDWRKLEQPGVKLWLYGKSQAKPGRKMGHFVVYDGGRERAEKLFASL